MSDMPCFLRKIIPDGVADSWARPAVFRDSLGRWSWLATLKPSNVSCGHHPLGGLSRVRRHGACASGDGDVAATCEDAAVVTVPFLRARGSR
jgi:hypothetical protein